MKASTAFVAAASATVASAALTTASTGGAMVINYCTSDFPYQNTPAMVSGADNAQAVSGTLQANGGTYFQNWVALDPAVQGGWSNKINALGTWSNIFQFEYTYITSTETVWVDMSFVNGVESELPAWKFVSTGTVMTTGAYQTATDDAEGMQLPVKPAAVVTLLLCPDNASAASTAAASTASSAVATVATTASAVQTTAASSTTLKTYTKSSSSSTSTTAAAETTPAVVANKQVEAAATSTTTVDTPIVPVIDANGFAVVTAYETKVVTAVVTETAVAHKHRRHEHRHPHGHTF